MFETQWIYPLKTYKLYLAKLNDKISEIPIELRRNGFILTPLSNVEFPSPTNEIGYMMKLVEKDLNDRPLLEHV